MRIYVSNTIRVIDPTKDMLTWARKVLTIPNPEFEKKIRMGYWVGNTPEYLSLYEIHGNVLELPFGMLRELPRELIEGVEIRPDFKDVRYVDFDADVSLYDYQQKAVCHLISYKYGILQAPAGSGKTQIGIALAAELHRPTLWLCHTKDLVNQSYDRAKLYMSEDKLGKITEGRVEIGECMTFATIQTMCKLDLQKYRDYWDVIITDECHRVAGSPTAMTRYYKVLNALAARHKYGLSATVHRADGLIASTLAILGRVVCTISDEDVSDKIMTVSVYPVETGTQLDRQALNPDGTLNYQKMITYLCGKENRNLLIASYIRDCPKPSLVLSERLEHLETLKSLMGEWEDQAVLISGKSKKKDREQALEDMRSGKKTFLFATYSLAKEGLDVPRLERLFLTTPQKDYAVIAQSIGRIARVSEGKGDPIAYDFVDDFRQAVKSYKARCTTYRKLKCDFIE